MLATFGFNRTALRATPPKLHWIFRALFLKIALSAAELMSFGHLGVAIICGVPDKCYADNPKAIDALRNNFVKPLVKYSCTQSIMCLKIGPIV